MSEFKLDAGAEPSAPLPWWRRAFHSGENSLVVFVLAALVIVPLAEVALRKVFGTGIAGSTSFVQHFTLLIGVLGGALAAREGRLLSLSTLPNLFKAHWKAVALIFSSGVAATI